MSKHSPGPWFVAYLDKNSQRVVENRHIEICTCWHHSVGAIELEMEANARLIASAPDLLSVYNAAKALADFVEKSTNVGPVTKGPHREARLWRELRNALQSAKIMEGV